MGMIREAALMQKVWLVPGWTAGDDEWSRRHHHLFAFLRVQDVSGWSLVLPRACSGVVVRSGGALQNQGSWAVMDS